MEVKINPNFSKDMKDLTKEEKLELIYEIQDYFQKIKKVVYRTFKYVAVYPSYDYEIFVVKTFSDREVARKSMNILQEQRGKDFLYCIFKCKYDGQPNWFF